MGEVLEALMKEGKVNIIGGCCGTAPDHIREFVRRAGGYKPRKVKERSGLAFSGRFRTVFRF